MTQKLIHRPARSTLPLHPAAHRGASRLRLSRHRICCRRAIGIPSRWIGPGTSAWPGAVRACCESPGLGWFRRPFRTHRKACPTFVSSSTTASRPSTGTVTWSSVRRLLPGLCPVLSQVLACGGLQRSSSLMRRASSSWSSRMTMRQAASTGVPWSTSSRARAAMRSW
jgi:hypothetical protein